MTEADKPISVSYSQLAVFDHSLERPFNVWTDRHVAQGFAWRPGSVAFRTIEESGRHLVSIRVDSQRVVSKSNANRIIDVPFVVPRNGKVEIGSISDSVSIEITPGIYQMRFECYEGVVDENPRIRLSFAKSNNPRFELVRADKEINLGADLLLTASPA